MNLTRRPGTLADTERCGTICYEAFKTIADRHLLLRYSPWPSLSGLFAPNRSSRITLFMATSIEAAVFAYVALIWVHPFRPH
jgi:hypothetical protein